MINKSIFRIVLATGVALGALPSFAHAQQNNTDAAASSDIILVSSQRQQYRGDVPLEEVPQTVQVIDSALLTQLNITTLDNALSLASGIARQNNFGGLWDAFAVRGFAGDENFPSGFLVNGFNGGRGYGGPRDASNIERIEILKGPNGAVFGRGEPGGTVNIITRKANVDDTFGSVTASLGSFNTFRLEGDLNIALTDTLAVRLNGAGERSDGFRDFVETEKFVFTPSVLFTPSSSTSISYEMEFVDQKVPFDRGVTAVNGVLGLIPRSRFLGEPGDGPIEIEVLGHQVHVQQEITRDWVLLGGFGYRDTSFVGFSSEANLDAFRQILDNDGQNLSRNRRFRDYNTENLVFRGEISGNFDTGAITHHILFGADWDRFEIDLLQQRFRGPGYTAGTPITAANNAINIFNPVYGQLPVPNATITNTLETQTSYGLYFQDQIDLSDRLKLRIGGRYDNFQQEIVTRPANTVSLVERERFSPTAGLLFQATDEIGLYGAYGTGFRPNSGTTFGGVPFEPETSRSFEAGLRFASMDGMINGTFAAFTMNKSNILTTDPANAGFSVTAGSARSRGIEADVNASLPGGLTIYATYAYTDTEWRSASLEFNFANPILPGDPLINIPKHNANLVISQALELEGVGLLTVGGGLNIVSSRLGETATNFFIPGYTVARLMASFEPSESVRFSLDVNNLFNETWYSSSYAQYWVAPGAPRSVTLRASFSF